MQTSVTAASLGPGPGDCRVVVVKAGPQWAELPPSWHLMPPVTTTIMKAINFIYPRNSKVGHYCYSLLNVLGIVIKPTIKVSKGGNKEGSKPLSDKVTLCNVYLYSIKD